MSDIFGIVICGVMAIFAIVQLVRLFGDYVTIFKLLKALNRELKIAIEGYKLDIKQQKRTRSKVLEGRQELKNDHKM